MKINSIEYKKMIDHHIRAQTQRKSATFAVGQPASNLSTSNSEQT